MTAVPLIIDGKPGSGVADEGSNTNVRHAARKIAACGYVKGRDLLKLGVVLPVVEGVILTLVVAFDWPIIGVRLVV